MKYKKSFIFSVNPRKPFQKLALHGIQAVHTTIDRVERDWNGSDSHDVLQLSVRSSSGTIRVSLHNSRKSPGNLLCPKHTSQSYPHY